MEDTKDTRTAAQKLSDLEGNMVQAYGTLDSIVKDLVLVKGALKLLDNKLNAFIKATVEGEQVSDEVIDRIMTENNINELANKVQKMVIEGIVAPEDTVSENSFVVGREADANGVVTNPRVQFVLKALAPDVQSKIVGAKVGDTLSFQDGKLQYTILESYKINDKLTPPEPAPETAPEPETPPSA